MVLHPSNKTSVKKYKHFLRINVFEYRNSFSVEIVESSKVRCAILQVQDSVGSKWGT